MTRLRLRQIAALVTTLALLLGLPWLATTLPWPNLDLSLLAWEVHLRSGRLPTGVGTAVLICALWALWGLYLAVLAAEMIGHLRRRPFQMKALRPLQLLAATTLGTVTAPALAHAAPVPTTAVVANEQPQDDEEDEAQFSEATEPMVVDRNRLIDDFDYDDDTLTEAMAEDVQATADLIDEHGAPELPIVVTGHTDAAGDSAYNLDLSERRAQAVVDVLRTHLGEDTMIEVGGEGDRSLLDSADDAEQRRVEISYSVLVPPPQPEPPDDEDPAPEEEASPEHTAPAVGLSLPGGLVLAMTAGAAGIVGGMALERRKDLPEAEENVEEQDEQEHTTVAVPASPPPSGAGSDEPDTSELTLIDLAHTPGLGIVGPGADGAARTLLVRALDEEESELTVVVPEEDLRALLDHDQRLPHLSEDASVHVTDSVDDALTLLQLQVLARHQAADEHEDEDPRKALEQGPQFVLLTRADTAVATEVTSLLAHIDAAPLSALLLGPWPTNGGSTLTLDERGHITAEAPLTDLSGHTWPATTSGQLHQSLRAYRDSPVPTPTAAEPERAEMQDEQEERQDEHAPEPGPSSSVVFEDETAEPPQGAVSVTLLGRITLAVHGRQVRPHRRASYEVLAYLAAHPAGVRLETAVDAMWPHDAPHRSIRRFHDACTAVRSACRPLLGEEATAVITHDGDLYQLNPDLVVCDLWRLESLLEEATHSEDSGAVTAAAAMFDADFASTADYVWAEGVRTRVRNQLVSALIEHAEQEKPSRAISMLRRALRINPTSETATRNLAQRYDAQADKKSADRVRSDYEAALEEVDAST